MDREATEEERQQARKNRFDRIQSVFQAQSAKDYDPVRARKLESVIEPALAEVARNAKTLELGVMECRGRMCGVDVGFDDPSEISTLHASVTQAMMSLDEVPPRVHLVTHAGDRDKRDVGRLFFEWIAPSAEPPDAP